MLRGSYFGLSSTPGLVGGGCSVCPEPIFIVFSMLAVVSVLLFQVRRTLIGTDLGTNWILIGAGILFYGILAWLGFTYGRHVSHLSFAVRMGAPELSCSDGQILVREGVYRVVRHPVYLTAAIGGISFVVNYVGVYILFVTAVPILYIITILEERELIARCGEEYRRYQREVPRLIPRWQRFGNEVWADLDLARTRSES
jgi:protein-S-isoprenylcysteine O-methyltransferase Ste14